MTFNKEAETRFLSFAASRDASWNGNFRDLSAAVTRMATFAPAGRITVDEVEQELATLTARWPKPENDANLDVLASVLSPDQLNDLDLFDQAQLVQVLDICQASSSLSDAGRKLFQASRRKRTSTNDSDRLRKYLAKFGLDWNTVANGKNAG